MFFLCMDYLFFNGLKFAHLWRTSQNHEDYFCFRLSTVILSFKIPKKEKQQNLLFFVAIILFYSIKLQTTEYAFNNMLLTNVQNSDPNNFKV